MIYGTERGDAGHILHVIDARASLILDLYFQYIRLASRYLYQIFILNTLTSRTGWVYLCISKRSQGTEPEISVLLEPCYTRWTTGTETSHNNTDKIKLNNELLSIDIDLYLFKKVCVKIIKAIYICAFPYYIMREDTDNYPAPSSIR